MFYKESAPENCVFYKGSELHCDMNFPLLHPINCHNRIDVEKEADGQRTVVIWCTLTFTVTGYRLRKKKEKKEKKSRLNFVINYHFEGIVYPEPSTLQSVVKNPYCPG